MNDQNVNPRNSVKDSLEAFRPFPAHREMKQDEKNNWLKLLKELLNTKH